MMRFHVHVYKVSHLCEVSVDANGEEDARRKALDYVKTGMPLWIPPDCTYLALGPEETWGQLTELKE